MRLLIVCGWLILAILLPGCGPNGPSGLATLTTDLPKDTLVFGQWSAENKTQLRSFSVTASGRDVTIESAEIVDDPGFSLETRLKFPFTLKSGQPIKLQVRFSSNGLKQHEGRLQIGCSACDNVDGNGFFNVKLGHESGGAKVLWRCDNPIDFGPVVVGKSRTKSCVLTNPGTMPFVVEGVQFKQDQTVTKPHFAWKSPSFPFTVAPGATGDVKVEVVYAPLGSLVSEESGQFSLVTNTNVVPFRDTGVLQVKGSIAKSAQIELVPKYPDCADDAACRSIDTRLRCTKDTFSGSQLCRQPANQTPLLKFPLTSKGKVTKRTFFIRNTGALPLKVDNIALSLSSSRDFRVVAAGVFFPLQLDPNTEKEITVEYLPSDEREDKGEIVVTSNAVTPTRTLELGAASRGCNLQVQPRKISFSGPTSKQVTIVNVGNESCLIKKVYFKSGTSKALSMLPPPSEGQTLVPNGSISFLVKYTPNQKAPIVDFIVIESTDPDEPTIEVELGGSGFGGRSCEIQASPATLNYALVPVGRSRKMSVTISNKGFRDCEVTALNVIGTNPAANNAFQLISPGRLPIKIAAGSNIRLDVAYTPPAQRSGYEGKLEIASNDTVQPNYEVKLVGSSGTLCLEIVPPNLDFGATKFGCASTNQTVEVFNLGSSNCSKSIRVTGLTLAQNTTSEFLIRSAPATPRTLNAGQSLRLELGYKAKDLGIDRATLQIGNSVAGQSPIPVPLVGEGVATNDQKDVFTQLKRPQLDLLFIIDDSSSVAEEQANLAKNMGALANWLVRLNVDYHVMVTTTDVTGAGGGAGCARGNTKIVTSQTPAPVDTIAGNVKVGTAGSASEKGLEAAYRALIPPASTTCNKGFYRKDAALSMIFMSDEPDQSPQTVQFYVSFFKSLKGQRSADLVRASAIVGPLPSGCRNPGTGSASAGPRYIQVAKELQGVNESVCRADWSNALNNIGTVSIGYRLQYYLSRKADPNTIKVLVNGKTIPEDAQNGWQLDPINNSVNLAKSQLPAPGATIQVEYKAICLP